MYLFCRQILFSRQIFTLATSSRPHVIMESQVSVRKNIALKLRDQGSSQTRIESPTSSNKEEGEIVEPTVASGIDPNNTEYSDLKWDHTLHLCGRPIKDPLIHLCEICSLPVLIYGRMKKCRHAFCRDCAKKASGVCPKCKEGDQSFEEASMGSVYVCTHGGGRYDNSGCGRSYLSQRDLDAHILYRHSKDKGLGQPVMSHLNPPPPPSSLAGFTLPPFFQSGIIAHRLPPGFGATLPPSIGSAVLRPPTMLPPRQPAATLGPPLIPPPFAVPPSMPPPNSM